MAGDDRREHLDQRLGSWAPDVLVAFLESVADGLYAVDAAGRVRFVNRAGLAILGYEDEGELLGAPSHATIHHHRPDGSAFPEADCPLLAPRVTGEVVRVDEDWFIRRDGSFVAVAYSSAPVATDDGRGAIVVFQDITERRSAQEAQARERAERARAAEVHASRARILDATLRERQRLGRDLHDGAQQRLVNIALGLQLAARDPDAGVAQGAVEAALAETRLAIADLRELAAGLHPSVLTHRGLRGALESATARAAVPVALDITTERFTPAQEATAYYVAVEALANVAKHADAAEASVRVAAEDDDLVVEVVDDGRGGAAAGGPDGGTGLAGMADRVAALDGTLTVVSPAGGGTRVRATLPLSSPAGA